MLYLNGPYLYKVYLYVSVFKIPNRSCILAMPHFALQYVLLAVYGSDSADYAPLQERGDVL